MLFRLKVIILFLISILVNNKLFASNINIMPNITFYNNYIYSNSIQLDMEYNYNINNHDFTFGGYISKYSIDSGNIFDSIDIKNNYRIMSAKIDSNNYFFKIYFKNKLYSYNNHKLYYTLSYKDSIKYNELLDFTYTNLIYKFFGLKIDYCSYINSIPINVFIGFYKNSKDIKDNINIGFNSYYLLSNEIKFKFGYSYNSDLKRTNNKVIIFNNIYSKLNINSILDKYHQFLIGYELLFSNNINADLQIEYILSKNDNRKNTLWFSIMLKK